MVKASGGRIVAELRSKTLRFVKFCAMVKSPSLVMRQRGRRRDSSCVKDLRFSRSSSVVLVRFTSNEDRLVRVVSSAIRSEGRATWVLRDSRVVRKGTHLKTAGTGSVEACPSLVVNLKTLAVQIVRDFRFVNLVKIM